VAHEHDVREIGARLAVDADALYDVLQRDAAIERKRPDRDVTLEGWCRGRD